MVTTTCGTHLFTKTDGTSVGCPKAFCHNGKCGLRMKELKALTASDLVRYINARDEWKGVRK
jgi:hypothetical protein